MFPPGPTLALAALVLLLAGSATAQSYSLLGGEGLFAARRPLFDRPASGAAAQPLIQARAQVPDTEAAEAARGRAQSLFIGRSAGFFAPRAGGVIGGVIGGGAGDAGPILGADPQAEMIRHIIARAEAGPDGYDAVQYGARRKPGRPPTQMTLGEIFDWIAATPGQPHAIGRYQFIPATLKRLVAIAGAGREDPFSPRMQDRLADILLREAGLDKYRAGGLTRHALMNNLAKIWAGLPNSSGRSHYHGYAGNAATMTWSQFDTEMARVFQS